MPSIEQAHTVLHLLIKEHGAQVDRPFDIVPLFTRPGLNKTTVRAAVRYWSHLGALRPVGDDRSYILTARGADFLTW